MADPLERLPENVPGRFYVDSNCIDCDICRGELPAFFRRDDETGYSIVFRQPETAEEVQLCHDAILGCPAEAIGDLETS
jgi:ferredoxin